MGGAAGNLTATLPPPPDRRLTSYVAWSHGKHRFETSHEVKLASWQYQRGFKKGVVLAGSMSALAPRAARWLASAGAISFFFSFRQSHSPLVCALIPLYHHAESLQRKSTKVASACRAVREKAQQTAYELHLECRRMGTVEVAARVPVNRCLVRHPGVWCMHRCGVRGECALGQPAVWQTSHGMGWDERAEVLVLGQGTMWTGRWRRRRGHHRAASRTGLASAGLASRAGAGRADLQPGEPMLLA